MTSRTASPKREPGSTLHPETLQPETVDPDPLHPQTVHPEVLAHLGMPPPDIRRMHVERRDKLRTMLDDAGIGVAVFLGTTGVSYVAGHCTPPSDAGLANHRRPVAVLTSHDPLPYCATPYPDMLPPELSGHRQAAIPTTTEEGALLLARQILEWASPIPDAIGIDELTGALHAHLARALSHLSGRQISLIDITRSLARARLHKTDDEVACIAVAQRMNELAMLTTEPLVTPGVRQSELTGQFLSRSLELGCDGWALDPIWQVMPHSADLGPATTHGDLAFPLTSTDRILRGGDVIWVDTGIIFQGYASDFGRTWIVGARNFPALADDAYPGTAQRRASLFSRPTPAQRDSFRRWHDVLESVVATIAPGVTGTDLIRAATTAYGGKRPWPPHFYLAHGLGLESAEAPLVGTDLGHAADDSLVLEEGMILVLEPETWGPIHCGYRGEEVIAVTPGGCRLLTHHHYAPYDD